MTSRRSSHHTVSERFDWETIVHRIGRRVFEMRCLLGISQDALARSADVSQGAVSRIESGRCENTPLLTYVKLFTALAKEIDTMDVRISSEMQSFIMAISRLVPNVISTAEVIPNPNLAKLLHLFGHMTENQQEKFLTLVTPIAEALREK